MGQGSRVTFNNTSQHTVYTSATDQDWVSEMHNLDGTLAPTEKQEQAYFEYTTGHVGHITLVFKSTVGQCRLGFVEFEPMPDRTVEQNGGLRIIHAETEIGGVRVIEVTILDS